MDLVFAYIAGLLTLINPCVLPILPIVLASAAQDDRRGPLLMAGGLSLSFVVLGMIVLVFGRAIGLTADGLVTIGAWGMLIFGLILLVPQFSERFATATAGVSGSADAGFDQVGRRGAWGQFAGGALLGAVWSPCIGPTLGGAIALASQGQSLAWATGIMIFFAAGVSTIILALGYGSREAIRSRRDWMAALAQRSRPIMGVAFVGVGLMILTKFHHVLEAWAIQTLPAWLIDLSVRF